MADASQLSDAELDRMLQDRGLVAREPDEILPPESEGGGILDYLDRTAQSAFPSYGAIRRDPGMTRKLVQGVTLSTGDEVEAGARSLAALFTDEDVSDAYNRNLSSIRGSLKEAEERAPITSFVTETAGGAIAPLGIAAKGAGWLRTLLGAGVDAGISGFAAGEGGVEERGDLAARSVALSPITAILGKSASDLASGSRATAQGFGTASEMKSIGLGKRAIGKATRADRVRTKNALASGKELPFTETALAAKSEGILEAGQNLAERVQVLGLEKVRAAKQIDQAVQLTDAGLQQIGGIQVTKANFPNTWRYLGQLPEDTPAFTKASKKISQYLEPIIDNINREGTVSKIIDQKRKLYGIGYLSKSPTVKQLEKAMARDLKQLSERHIKAAVSTGLVPEEAAEAFFRGNARYGQFEALQNAYVDDAASVLPQDALETLVAQIRTSGGAGVPTILSGGNPAFAAILGAGRTETGQDLIGKGFRGAEAVMDAVEPVVAPVAGNVRSGLVAQQLLDTEEGGADEDSAGGIADLSDSDLDTLLRERGLFDEPKKKESRDRLSDLGPAQEVATKLSSLGYSPAAIAGILGNIDVETGGSFSHSQKQKGGGGGYGLFQFDFMKPFYKTWLQENGIEDSNDAQIEFMDQVVTGTPMRKSSKAEAVPILGEGERLQLIEAFNTDDPLHIAEMFMKIFEKPGKPHKERRLASAKQYETLLS